MKTPSSQDSIEALEQIESICEEFEAQCQNDLQHVSISEFLDRVEPGTQGRLLFELILLKVDYQMQAGNWPERVAYMEEFPEFQDVVSKAFQKIAEGSHRSDSKLPDLGRRFEILELLGSGGMGSVYRARDVKLGRDVAVKTLKRETVELDKRFEREIRLTASLMHPNIVSLYDFIEHRGTKFAVLELVSGMTLRERLKSSGPIELEEAVRIATAMARALEAAHQPGIIHRDIKPENVMIADSGHVKVLDFGLARPIAAKTALSLTKERNNPGTFPYMSPEQVSNQSLSRATDIFSLGTVMLEMLTGTNPFLGSNIAETTQRIVETTPQEIHQLSSKVSPQLSALIVDMLAKSIEQRPTAKQIVQRLTQSQSSDQHDSTGMGIAILPTNNDNVPTNLPMRHKELVGREKPLAELAERIKTPSLTTVVGAGGTGKTSLAYQAVRENLFQFPGGVWVCELASLQPDGDVAQTLAAAIDRTEGNIRKADDVINQLQDQRVLILLDNCEHVIDAAAELAAQLLERLPMLTIVATSRRPLDIDGEHAYFLDGLNSEGPKSDAVEMFVQCASSKAGYQDEPASRQLIEKIVARLEGLPLLIELAAPRLKSMTLAELLDGLDNQLAALKGRRGVSDRQTTVGQMIAWSFDLLNSSEQELLIALSVFRGSFTKDAAYAVTELHEAATILPQLVEQSVVVRVPANGPSRFRLLEPIRQFCETRISDDTRRFVAERHARFVASRMRQIGVAFHGPNEPEAAQQLNYEWADLRAAIHWGLENQVPEVAIDALIHLGGILLLHSRVEAFGWLEQAEQRMPNITSSRADVLALIGFGKYCVGDLEQMEKYADLSNAIAPNAFAEIVAGTVHWMREESLDAADKYRRAKELANPSDDVKEWLLVSTPLEALALGSFDPHHDSIEELFADSEAIMVERGWPTGIVFQLVIQAQVASFRGDQQLRDSLLKEAISRAQNCGSLWLQNYATLLLGTTEDSKSKVDDFNDAIDRLTQMIEAKMFIHIPYCIHTLTLLMIELGLDEAAAKCTIVPEKLFGGLAKNFPTFPQAIGKLERRLGSEEFESLQKIGETLTIQDVLELCKQSLANLNRHPDC